MICEECDHMRVMILMTCDNDYKMYYGDVRGGSRHLARGSHHVADPDIRLGGKSNMFPCISRLFLHWRGPKSIAKLDGGPWLDLPRPLDEMINEEEELEEGSDNGQ